MRPFSLPITAAAGNIPGIMRTRRLRLFGLMLLALALPAILLWQQYRPSDTRIGLAAMTSDPPTAEPTPSPTAPPTRTAQPAASATPTMRPTSTSTPTETSTPLPTATATSTPLPSATPPDRSCPAELPVKPEYARYTLGSVAWPTPDPAGFTPHFWLDTPILLDEDEPEITVNPGYPYGSDGNGRYLLHNAVDISGDLGVPLLAAIDGTVAVAQNDYTELYGWRCDWYGHLVVIEADARYRGLPVYVLYGHVLNLSVEPGDLVQTGRQVAEVGVGGASTAAHLHLEVRVGGNEFGMTRNPLLWLKPAEERGLIAGRLVDPEGRPWQGVQIIAAGPAYATTWSYLDDPMHYIRPDDELGENFVFGDLQPGNYRVLVTVQGTEYAANVTVEAGQVSQVEIVTEAYRTPTPAPPATATAVATATSDESDLPAPTETRAPDDNSSP